MAPRTKHVPPGADQNGVAAPPAAETPKKRLYADPMAVTWMERYSDQMEEIWGRLPKFVGSTIVFASVFTLGATMHGEWLFVLAHLLKYFGVAPSPPSTKDSSWSWSELTLERLYLENISYFFFGAITVSYGMYFCVGGFLHWFWYVRRRDNPQEWKCQPEKWLPPDLERHEIITGSVALGIASTLTAFVACYIYNGGWSMVYFELDEYGWTWWFLQWPVIFIYQDYTTYWNHRIYHWPFLYKHFHKLHHKYKQPTAFSVTAMHPAEISHMQMTMLLPIFLVPIHFAPFCGVALYNYYHGILDHSGINFKSFWWQPWQPDAIFHDNHHQYFHVNFGFNMYYWDILHGTYRRKDRVYHEDVYYGQGVALEEATAEEVQADMAERRSENPLAYRNNKREYDLEESELKTSRQRSKKTTAAARKQPRGANGSKND